MANLPLRFVYVNGVRDHSRPTTERLPNGEAINISNSYIKLLSFFTSGKISPVELKKMGDQKLKALLDQVSLMRSTQSSWGLLSTKPFGDIMPTKVTLSDLTLKTEGFKFLAWVIRTHHFSGKSSSLTPSLTWCISNLSASLLLPRQKSWRSSTRA